MSSTGPIPVGASAAVLKPSEPMPEFAVTVQGPNFDDDISLQKLLDSYSRIGFQANSLGKAIEIVNKMVCSAKVRQCVSNLTSYTAQLAIV